jgi:hypothetical protein
VQVLAVGAILAPGERTVAAVLRVMGLGGERHFQNYHRVLNRAVWSGREISRQLLGLLLTTFAQRYPQVLGLDDTIERRRGAHIKAKGIYRDPVRSSHGHFVKASGLRWLSLMLLVPIPWAQWIWALPFMTVLAPSERYNQRRGRKPKKLTDWARQMLLQVRRWLPERRLVMVADASFAALELLGRMSRLTSPIAMITRLRLDAALYRPAPPPTGKKGRPRKKGARLPTLQQVLENPGTHWQLLSLTHCYGEGQRKVEIVSSTAVWYHSGKAPLPIRWVLIRDPQDKFRPQDLVCTDFAMQACQILKCFVRRWQVEVTFHEVRTHLVGKTQRQWSDRAIARTTPTLLGLFSLVTLLAHGHACRSQLPVRQTAWYWKTRPTFSDALAVVRKELWGHAYFSPCQGIPDMQKVPAVLLGCLRNAVCYST